MRSQNVPQGRIRRTVNDLVMAEMFLVQATIESATVISNGINELISQRDDAGEGESISSALQRIAEDAVEPYSSRYQYFRHMLNIQD
jgi:hypothetical protein